MPTIERMVFVMLVMMPALPKSSVGIPSGVMASTAHLVELVELLMHSLRSLAAIARPAKRVAIAAAPVRVCPMIFVIFFIIEFNYTTKT